VSGVDLPTVGFFAVVGVLVLLVWLRSMDTRRRRERRDRLVRACRAGMLRSAAVVGDGLRPIVLAVRAPTDAAWLLGDQGHHAIRAVVGEVELTNRADSRVEVR
jgi:hypothetical protein